MDYHKAALDIFLEMVYVPEDKYSNYEEIVVYDDELKHRRSYKASMTRTNKALRIELEQISESVRWPIDGSFDK